MRGDVARVGRIALALGLLAAGAAACVLDDENNWNDNPCYNQFCGGHGVCVVAEDGKGIRCLCDLGFLADGLDCVRDPDYEEPDPWGVCFGVTCSHHGDCVNSGGTPRCICDPGYEPQGILQCVPAGHDPCQGVDCGAHGTCAVYAGDEAICACDPGYRPEGLRCVPDPDSEPEPELCSADGWCWENRRPQGNDLVAIHGLDADDAWAVGDRGALLHWDGVDWTALPDAAGVPLADVWGAHQSDVWAVGRAGTILHYNGQGWAPGASGATAQDLLAIHGTASDDVWAVGRAGAILHWDGEAWSEVHSGTPLDLHDVWAAAADDVWAVGASGIILRHDGQGWTSLEVSAQYELSTVQGIPGSNRVLAGGGECTAPGEEWRPCWGLTLIWDGQSWRDVGWAEGQPLTAIWDAGRDGRLWATADHGILAWDDGAETWVAQTTDAGRKLTAGWHRSAFDIVLVGEAGTVLHWSTEFVEHSSGSRSWLQAVHATGGESHVWAVGQDGALLRRADGLWSEESYGATTPLWDVWGASSREVWVVGDRGVLLRWDGSAWTRESLDIEEDLLGLWGITQDDVWAYGRRTLLHWDGATWTAGDTPDSQELSLLWGVAPDDAWAVLLDGSLLHWDGTAWVAVATPEPGVLGLWGAAGDDVWAVGGWCDEPGDALRCAGYAMHWDGTRWSQPEWLLDGGVLLDVWGSASDDVWAAGSAGQLWRWDGSTWTSLDSGTAHTLAGIHGVGGQIWVVGAQGTVLRHDR